MPALPSCRPSRPSPLTTIALRVGAICGGAFALAASSCSPRTPTESLEPVELTIAELHDALREQRTTCRAVVEAHLARIEAYEWEINAITVVNERALETADSLDAVQREGGALGELHCVPMLVKDNFDTHDLTTAAGSIAMRDHLPPDDAFMVRQIREAGAVVVAKTNMAEWAFSPRETVSSAFDTTRNAYALDRVPAGSSGGTASGVAAAFGLIGLGSDTGNSIRGPSAHAALVGIRSTIGLTSRDGVVPLAFDRDIAGPMGRTVEDVARVFRVVAGPDPADPYTREAGAYPLPPLEAMLDAQALAGTRIGVFAPLVDREETDSGILEIFDAAVADLRSLGAEVVEVEFDLQAQLTRRGMFCGRFRYDMAQYLATLGPAAPFTDVAEVLETGAYHPSVEGSLRRSADAPVDVPPAQWSEPCADYFDNTERLAFRDAVVAAMDAAEVVALIHPSWGAPPAHIDRASEEYRADHSQRVAPATGLPALTVPMGWLDDGMPSGLQWLGRPWADADLLRLAYAYEQGTRHRRPPPGFPPLTGTGAGPAPAAPPTP